MSTTHIAKRLKTSAAPLLYSNVDLSRLSIGANPVGNEIKHATVTYNGSERLSFQLCGATDSLRAPFGVDDGSKYGNKPSLSIELPTEQLAFIQDGIEAVVKAAAVTYKATWFRGIKPLPSDDAVRDSFSSRIKTDDSGKYPPSLKVNVCLVSGPKHVLVHSTTHAWPMGGSVNPSVTRCIQLSAVATSSQCYAPPEASGFP